jgi:multidrug transporter EmrE-like cation transporter
MKHRLLTFDYVFWYVTIVCEVVACCALIKRKQFFQHWRVFSYYLFYITSASILTLAVDQFGSPNAYAVTYSLVDFIEAILLNLVLLEILVKVLAPFESLPGRTVAKFCFWAVLGISAAVAFSVMMPSGNKGPLIEVPVTIERTIFLADASLLWILLVQAKKLGITWKSSVAEIAIGFVLYLTVQSTTRFVASIYTGPILRSLSSEVGQFAFLIAVTSWTWTIINRDPVGVPLSSEAVARIQKPHKEDESVTKERIFAAVGIKVNKPEEKTSPEDATKEESGASLPELPV